MPEESLIKIKCPSWGCKNILEIKLETDEKQIENVEWFDEEYENVPLPASVFTTTCPKCTSFIVVSLTDGRDTGLFPVRSGENKQYAITPLEYLISIPAFKLSRRKPNNKVHASSQRISEILWQLAISLSFGFIFAGLIPFLFFTDDPLPWTIMRLGQGLTYGFLLFVTLRIFREIKRIIGTSMLHLTTGKPKAYLDYFLQSTTKNYVALFFIYTLAWGIPSVIYFSQGGSLNTMSAIRLTIAQMFMAIPLSLIVFFVIGAVVFSYVFYVSVLSAKVDYKNFNPFIAFVDEYCDVTLRLMLSATLMESIILFIYQYATGKAFWDIAKSSQAGLLVITSVIILMILPFGLLSYYLSRTIEVIKHRAIHSLAKAEDSKINKFEIYNDIKQTPNRLYYLDYLVRIVIAAILFGTGISITTMPSVGL